MAEEKKETAKAAAAKHADAPVRMKHEFARYVHRVAIGEEWFDVAADGLAEFPLRLVDAAELAGFRRVE